MLRYRQLGSPQAISIALLAALLATASLRAAQPSHLLRDFARTQLIIDTSGHNCVLFDVYVAQNSEQRSQGLMYIESMDMHEGMLFIYPESALIRMWMKNTLISLDMLFLDERLTVAHLHKNAVPLSEDIIDSRVPVTAVIELNAGTTGRFNITVGDRIILAAD